MKEAIRQELLHDISKAIEILEQRESKDIEELRKLSDHSISDIAVHKDLELVSVTVLLYSLYKVVPSLTSQDYLAVLQELKRAQHHLKQHVFGSYNRNVKKLYLLIRQTNEQVREHLQDVMTAARIKKGTVLLQQGLSIGQAAGLMGLSNWDLQAYAGKTSLLAEDHEVIPAQQRLKKTFQVFGL